MRNTRATLAVLSLSAIMAGGAVVGATAANAAECQGGYPASQCQVELSDNAVRPGEPVSFQADGYTPGETAEGVVRSTPIKVGTYKANASGVVTGSFTVPASLKPGRHSFTLTGLSSGAIKRTYFTVTGTGNGNGNGNGAGTGAGSNNGGNGSGLPVTGSNVGGLIGGGAALVAAGGMLMVASRRRKSVNPAI